MKVAILLAAVSIATLAGCSNPKEPSKANFEHAINDWIEKGPPCISIPDGTVSGTQQRDGLPVYVEAAPAKGPGMEKFRQAHLAPLNALVETGLMRASQIEVDQKDLFGMSAKKAAVTAFDLTDKGKEAYKKDAGRASMSGLRTGFCYGKPHVDEITNFTQPADLMGMTISQVSYKYHLTDLPDWAKSAKVKAAFPDVARLTADSLDGKAAVVLTNDGWKHEKAI